MKKEILDCGVTARLLQKTICRRRRLDENPLQVSYKQDWGRQFILLLPQTVVLPGSDAGSDGVKPALNFFIQNRPPCAPCCARCTGHVIKI